jgi:hypothetical protein
MGYAQVLSENDLPPVWAELANCEKRERITILQTAFRRFARRENLSTPQATAELTNIVINLQFLSPDDEKLDLGLQPFAVAYIDQRTVAEQQILNDAHNRIYESTPTYKDLVDLRKAGKLPIPTAERQIRKTLEAFAVTLGVLVGTRSLLYKACWTFIVDDFNRISDRLADLHEEQPHQMAYPKYLRWLQLRFQSYWESAEANAVDARVPRFENLHDDIRNQQWRAPAIPPGYLPTPKKKPPPTGGGGASDERRRTLPYTDNTHNRDPVNQCIDY